MQSFKKRKSETEKGMLWKRRLEAKKAETEQQLGQAARNRKSRRGDVMGLQHSNRDELESVPSAHLSAKLNETRRIKKQAVPQQEQVWPYSC
jgi:hypothetical protein